MGRGRTQEKADAKFLERRQGALRTPNERTDVSASYHAPVERHRQMKMDFPLLMVRRAHHER